jgi:hypothetical protein
VGVCVSIVLQDLSAENFRLCESIDSLYKAPMSVLFECNGISYLPRLCTL